MEEIEEARVREVRQEGEPDGGESVVRIRRERRRWPLLVIVGAIVLIIIALLLTGSREEAGVSLPAARKVLVEKSPDWQKPPMLRALRAAGFRATPGPPRSPLQITVTLRRDGLLLRSQTDRLWVLREEFE